MKEFVLAALVVSLSLNVTADTAASTENVTIDNFVRAESDTMLKKSLGTLQMVAPGTQLGELGHIRTPFPLDRQPVIRMNRDTLYSSTVLDLSKPVQITLPEIDGRYQSAHIVSQDHLMEAYSEPGTYKITQDKMGTRYALLTIRTLADADDTQDIKVANLAQDKVKISGGVIGGEIETPNWDQEKLTELRQLLSQIALFDVDPAKAFGRKGEVDPVHYFIGSAAGWGGLPKNEAMYEISEVTNNDGSPHSVTFKDVPVDAFWSVTVYNEQGYIAENELGRYSFNNMTTEKNADGSATINFGACDDGRVNCLPISEGWNYAFRYYKPQQALMSGEWTSPEVTPIK